MTLGLVVLLCLAGCGSVSDSQATPDSTTLATNESTTVASPSSVASTTRPTATPPSTATSSPSSTPATVEQVPVGINSEGVENVSAVIAGHEARLVATPGVVTHSTNATLGGRSVVASVRVAATSNLTRVRYVSRAEASTENGTRTVVEAITANETTVGQYAAVNGNVTLDNRQNRSGVFEMALPGLSTAANPLRGTLSRGEFTVTNVTTVDGTDLVTLRSDRYVGERPLASSNVANYTATVQVTESGLIRSATERIVGTVDGDRRYYIYTYRFAPMTVDLPPSPRIPEEVRVSERGSINTTDTTPRPD